MKSRSLAIALVLAISTPVSSDEVSRSAVQLHVKSSKSVHSASLAIGIENSDGSFYGVALVAR